MTETIDPRPGRRMTPTQDRDGNMRRNYGITLAEYDAMRAAQDNRCAICGRHEDDVDMRSMGGRPRRDGTTMPPEHRSRFAIDHNHRTGAVRGLLCSPCNRLLGKAGDDIEMLRRAIAYLERAGT